MHSERATTPRRTKEAIMRCHSYQSPLLCARMKAQWWGVTAGRAKSFDQDYDQEQEAEEAVEAEAEEEL
jgi:hypothetical protein